MGIVLKAQDSKLNRIVAVKVLAPELGANVTARKRFLKEAQSAAAVGHEHVVAIHAVEDGGQDHSALPYLVMEFIDGVSLQQKIDSAGPLELKEILRIGHQVAAGLSAAHLQGLIHRDVKPSNILLQNGVQRVKITDFGLARAVDDVGMTRTGEVTGTPQYMSPEQAQGHKVDPRSDLFSLGSVLYTMCTGRGPFRADSTVASLRRVCDDTPRPIREINPDIPIWLVDIIDSLLQKKPDDRIQSAEEVADVLAKCLARLQAVGPSSMTGIVLPHKQRQVQKPSRRISPPRRNWMVPAMILLTLGMLFSVSEATGVTQLSSTVIRIMTGEGTLVVEVDDPSVEVSINGEELSITGAGLQEIKLRPGQYKFKVTKDGQPIEQKLVSISRGDREVVRVTRQAPDVAASGSNTEPGTFVVLNSHGKQAGKFDTLNDAVLGSTAGDTIEIRGNGPVVVTENVVVPHSIRICAAEGYAPVFRADKSLELDRTNPLITLWAPAVLEGIQVDCLHAQDWEVMRFLIQARSTLKISNCRIISSARAVGIVAQSDCDVVNCDLRVSPDAGLEFPFFQPGQTFRVNNSVLGGIRVGTTADSRVSVNLDSNTFCSEWTNISIMPIGPDGPKTALESLENAGTLAVFSKNNLFYGQESFVRLHDTFVGKLTVADASEWAESQLQWRDEGSLIDRTASPIVEIFHHSTYERPVVFQELDDWQVSGTTDQRKLDRGVVKFKGGVVFTSLRGGSILPLEGFRLRPDSAGYQAGSNGKDLGANIDFVGPGEAYEHWKKTDDYQQWLLETTELMHGNTGSRANAAGTETRVSSVD